MKVKLLFVLILSLISIEVYSQDANLIWTKTHKLTKAPNIHLITNDNKYMILGYLNNFLSLNFYDFAKKDFIQDSAMPKFNRISAICLNVNNNLLGVGYSGANRVFFNYDCSNLKNIKTTVVEPQFKNLNSFNISPKCNFIYGNLNDSIFAIWDTKDFSLIESINKKNNSVPINFNFSKDESKVIFAKNNKVYILNFATKDTISKLVIDEILAVQHLEFIGQNNFLYFDNNSSTVKRYDFNGVLISETDNKDNLGISELSEDGSQLYRIKKDKGITVFNYSTGNIELIPFVSPESFSITNFNNKNVYILSGNSYLKIIEKPSKSEIFRMDLNNFTDVRYLDNVLYCLQSSGNIIPLNTISGKGDGLPQYEKSNLKLINLNNKFAAENVDNKKIVTYSLKNLNVPVDSLSGDFDILNFNFCQSANVVHINAGSNNYIFNYDYKEKFLEHDSLEIQWSSWKGLIITNTVLDAQNSKILVRKGYGGEKIVEFNKNKNSKILITQNDDCIYSEIKGTDVISSIGWEKYSLDNPGVKDIITFKDTLYGSRSKSMLIRRDWHLFTYNSQKPEFWIRDIATGKLIYYNKCQKTGTILNVAFSEDYRQFTLIFNDGSLNTYLLPDGLLDIDESIKENQILIYPNPASNNIEISLSPAGGGRGWTPETDVILTMNEVNWKNLVEIYNIFGESLPPRLTSSDTPPYKGGEKIRIDISYLPTGVYFIKIGDKFEKFVKM